MTANHFLDQFSHKMKNNLILIGMPGAGKSTIGIVLAKLTSRAFIDTDILIQTDTKQSLQEILDSKGYLALRAIEEEVLLSLAVSDCIIATGGSAVYSESAMKHLSDSGIIVFLDVAYSVLEKRVTNYNSRGIAAVPGQSFQDLFRERKVLYEKYRDITITCNEKSHDQIAQQIVLESNKYM